MDLTRFGYVAGVQLSFWRVSLALSLGVFVTSVALVAATLHFGAEVKGARRWIVLLGVNVQPSEFLKPAFVILVAWLFGESSGRPEMPANSIALALLIVAVTGLGFQRLPQRLLVVGLPGTELGSQGKGAPRRIRVEELEERTHSIGHPTPISVNTGRNGGTQSFGFSIACTV